MSWMTKSNATINSVKSYAPHVNNNNNSYLKNFDLSACYDSFKKHWQQIDEIIDNYDVSKSHSVF